MNKWTVLLGLLAVSFLVQALGAWLTLSEIGGWYQELQKPSFNPPNWIFGPVWTCLYIMMALAAWLIYRTRDWPGAKAPLTFYLIHLVFNLAWSLIFFRWHALGWALVDIAFLWCLIGILVVWFGRIRLATLWLLLPYWLWVSFAATLNLAIYRLNP